MLILIRILFEPMIFSSQFLIRDSGYPRKNMRVSLLPFSDEYHLRQRKKIDVTRLISCHLRRIKVSVR